EHRLVDVSTFDQPADRDCARVDPERSERGMQRDRVVADRRGPQRHTPEGGHRHYTLNPPGKISPPDPRAVSSGSNSDAKSKAGSRPPQRTAAPAAPPHAAPPCPPAASSVVMSPRTPSPALAGR